MVAPPATPMRLTNSGSSVRRAFFIVIHDANQAWTIPTEIRDLEDEIGFCLLERTAKSVRLTDAGRAFLDNARALLKSADEAVAKERAIAIAEPTELHVGYSPMPTAEILPKTLRAFQQAMPNVHVRSHDWTNKDILAGIRDGRLQVGLIVPHTKGQCAARCAI
jgi:DNA-binding transcriptional LysR family regulator